MVPLLQSIHILTVGVVFVSVLVVALRVLGWMRAEDPLAVVWKRFAPFLWVGVGVMALTGSLLTVAEPVREFMTLSFRIKLVLLALAGLNVLLFHGGLGRSAARWDVAAAIPLPARASALLSLLLWIAILLAGRFIGFFLVG